MRVHQLTTCDEGITNPKRSTFGVTLALRWGDVLHPLGSEGNWFKPPYFTRILRFYMPMAVPTILCAVWFKLVLMAFEWAVGSFGYWGLLSSLLLLTFPVIPGAFVSWNLWGWRGYLGMGKCYGADAPEYLYWMPAEDVYEGSQAIQFSARLRISD